MSDQVIRYAANYKGRDFIVGDLHGCFRLLEEELAARQFDEQVDRLFSTGDLVDRNPLSHEALEWLRKPYFHAVRGNHEQMAIDYVKGQINQDNYCVGGDGEWFLALTSAERRQYAKAFLDLPLMIEITTSAGMVGLVHAEPTDDWVQFKRGLMHKDHAMQIIALHGRRRFKNRIATEVRNIGLVFVGHTVVDQPSYLGNVVYVDTGAVFGGKLTVTPLRQP